MTCQCCPYGPFTTIPVLFGLCALVLTWTFTFACDLFTSDYTYLNQRAGDELGSRGYGPWTVQGISSIEGDFTDDGVSVYAYSVCLGWYDTFGSITLDKMIIVSQAFSLLSVIVASCLSCMMWFPVCCNFGTSSKTLFGLMAIMAFFLGIFCLLTLIALAAPICANENCTLGWSGIVCIVTGVLWFLIVPCLCVLPKHARDDPDAAPPLPTQQAGMVAATTGVAAGNAEKVVTKTHNADGSVSVVTVTTTINPDGSKTVTEQTDFEPAPEAPVEEP